MRGYIRSTLFHTLGAFAHATMPPTTWVSSGGGGHWPRLTFDAADADGVVDDGDGDGDAGNLGCL